MARFFQYCPSIVDADAIGYSVTALHEQLLRAGHISFLVCQDDMRKISVREAHGFSSLLKVSWGSDDILILHHSFFNENLSALLDIPVRKVLVYHNITPGEYFKEVNMMGLANACDAGREQLYSARDAIDAAVAMSDYSANELRRLDYKECCVIPVLYDDSFFENTIIDYQKYVKTRSFKALNIIFVGRFVPNKRPDKLIIMISEYKRLFGRQITLHLVGKIWDETYTAGLMANAANLGVLSDLRMHISVSQLEVKTLLAAADAFVSFSEHEGFMVPLIEAFTVGCPVIAYRAAAIPETMGKAGIGMDVSDPALAAGLIELLRRDRATRLEVIKEQAARAMQFRSEVTAQLWRDFFQEKFGIADKSGPKCE